MVEILPIRVLEETDSQIFGGLAVLLAKLLRADVPVAAGIVVTPPSLKLKTSLEHYDFGTKEIFEQSLTLVKKEINRTPVPEILVKETDKHKEFLLNGIVIKSAKKLWLELLNVWLEQVKSKLWNEGFYQGITENLDPQVVIFIQKPVAYGLAYFDNLSDDSVINVIFGKIHPSDLKKLDEMVRLANKKLFIPHQYEWVVDRGVKLTKVLPYTPLSPIANPEGAWQSIAEDRYLANASRDDKKSAVKVFLDLSSGLVVEKEVDGIYIAAEKIFDLNKPRDSYEDLVFKLVESSSSFPNSPILFKLADKSEGMGKIRGALRLLHQKSLFDPMIDALDFISHKRGITNIHIVIPFVRTKTEFLQIKRNLAVKKLSRKNSLQLWLELCTPENLINLEDYLLAGLDGAVMNLDELSSYLNGFDYTQEDLMFYKNEVSGLLKFIADGIKLLHKSKVPFITVGSLSLYPEVLDFLVEKGVYGIVIEKYEAPSIHELLHQAERRLILRKST